MKVLNKQVKLNEDHRPVLLITIELPLEVTGPQTTNQDFAADFVKAIKEYEDSAALKEGE